MTEILLSSLAYGVVFLGPFVAGSITEFLIHHFEKGEHHDRA